MRKLASIQKIIDIKPIPDADKIEVATILGWKVVVKKDEFKIGDLCVYCEIDSVLPEREEFDFLKDKKYRIKSCKLKKQLSQGIAFPLNILPDNITTVYEGMDVTEILNIVKYEPAVPSSLSGIMRGNFPSFIEKTDEDRLQSNPKYLTNYDIYNYYVTEKVDGTSCTIYCHDMEVGVCSRNVDLKLTDDNLSNLYVKTAKEYNLLEKVHNLSIKYKNDYALQGEIVGPGVQGNKYNLSKVEFRLFGIFDINRYQRIEFDLFKRYADELELIAVPILDENFTLFDTVDKFVEYSFGKSILNNNVLREGVVIKHKIKDISFKVINPEFLLKHGE